MAYKIVYTFDRGKNSNTVYLIACHLSRYDNPLRFLEGLGLTFNREILSIEKFGEPFMEV